MAIAPLALAFAIPLRLIGPEIGAMLVQALLAHVVQLAPKGVGFALDACDGRTIRMIIAHHAVRHGVRCTR
ncbi:hypothetical protein D9M69_409850 [compost metagenome]